MSAARNAHRRFPFTHLLRARSLLMTALRVRFQVESLEDRCLPSTYAGFDLATPQSGPFPSDLFTIADINQNTGRRVDLPLPDAATHPSDFDDVTVINTLDGFNLQPRLSIPFSGP